MKREEITTMNNKLIIVMPFKYKTIVKIFSIINHKINENSLIYYKGFRIDAAKVSSYPFKASYNHVHNLECSFSN